MPEARVRQVEFSTHTFTVATVAPSSHHLTPTPRTVFVPCIRDIRELKLHPKTCCLGCIRVPSQYTRVVHIQVPLLNLCSRLYEELQGPGGGGGAIHVLAALAHAVDTRSFLLKNTSRHAEVR